MVIIIGDNFFDGLQVVFGTMLVWSEVGNLASYFTISKVVLLTRVKITKLFLRIKDSKDNIE